MHLIISSQEKYFETTKREIMKADCLLLVYDMTTSSGSDNIKTKWIPLIKDLNEKCPLILLGSKLDIILKDEEMFTRNRIRRVAKSIFLISNVKI